MNRLTKIMAVVALAMTLPQGCNNNSEAGTEKSGAINRSSAAEKVYVAPGEYDEFYSFMSGGFSGQISVYGLPSGRLLKVIPVFSVDGEKGYGFNEETKPLLETTHGFIPWDDAHHPELSQTNGVPDGKYIFINGNNTPRVARVDLTTFETAEIIELPNAGGNHSSPFTTENSEYVVAGTRFSVPVPQKDVPIATYKENFKGALSFISVDPEHGHMDIDFQVLMPGYDYDLAHAGKGKSHGWMFFTTYNTEQSHTLKEVNASQNDKDYIAAINWKKAQEYIKDGKFKEMDTEYLINRYDENKHMAETIKRNKVRVLDASEYPGVVYFLPTPKSPHGVDVDPTGSYIIGNGKLNANLTVHSFDKMIQAIENESFAGDAYGIPVLNFEDVVAGTVESGGLGPLHTEFDGKGNAYTTFFISSEVVKWKLDTWEVLDRIPTYYSVGHLMIPGGDSKEPWGKYMVALNKITKDRYLPTGPELAHSAQLYDISGDKMELILDFPTIGEPHYAQAIPADLVAPNSKKIYSLEENAHPYATKSEKDTRVEKKGNEVHIYMTTIRSHFAPDNVEGIEVGDKVYFHVTNLEQDWDVPHGFSVMGAQTAELLIMPGQTETLLWEPKKPGVIPFYCTDFCSALHQEMQGYLRVSAKGQAPEVTATTGE
ncbi:nitrous oxide reductase [Owenweeksia hongkongensis DSM 17368]|uniref:Nitrous oxide reductase n=1 Tax=Owenweeksia hongkongensis (strain DSM 17368 / CIP 108786 / JCM 12287 / NRRL B-23963 / UST20020801) TaxID=926562 RepID=G8R6E9_OWEHD|nr:Sec-dependent nitrous-oxide reductase [Owenweeksia hongkongensis]AEV34412.1 nitrous oxide reductase [Owenweeksia hongkongensis DSM 17368]